ncbi:hypothetical protein, variant [Cladophialophora immunda]|uniref:Uncharacterized protein n=1 Tax=Cladophialophora immunda TaxID=569365 RepID=A0A0D2D1D5_9EURO|nr:uncharacterized protein PV07_05365 [Cladophialophora immunda]XP_016249770.1 hypothetical protein, variant [Cladophialophora immunda]KIW29553.1 hypothetical protein PV07_05365 [Cladophialophora immunda]KIW29554.1 hypothetical protein, variant [Cladophialophora immunda]
MDHLKEQEAGRQRMRDLFQQRELERGSLRRKRIFKTPEEEAKQAVRLTPNAQARNERELTATRGQAPVFNENIWNGERRRPAPNEIRSVSPRTRVDEDGGFTTSKDNGDVKKSDDGARMSGGSHDGNNRNNRNNSKNSNNSNKTSHNSASTDKKSSS